MYPQITTTPSPLLPSSPGTLRYLNPSIYLPSYNHTYIVRNELGIDCSQIFTPDFSSSEINSTPNIRGVISNLQGDIYFAVSDTIYKITHGQSVATIYFQNSGSNFQQLAFNTSGHLFAADIYIVNSIISYLIWDTISLQNIDVTSYFNSTPNSNYIGRLLSIAVSSNNILYFGGLNGNIFSFYADLTTSPSISTFIPNIYSQEYIYFKIYNNYLYSVTLYTTNFSISSIYRINLSTAIPEVVIGSQYGFYALDVDRYGNLYVSNYRTPNIITQYTNTGTIIRTIPSGANVVSSPTNNFCLGIGMSFLPNDNLVLAGLTNLIQQNITYNFNFNNIFLQNGNNVLYVFDYTTNNIIFSFDYIISSICFKEGTKILCLLNKKEIYIPIQNIVEGMLVKTYKNGYRKVKIIAKGQIFNSNKRCIDKLFKLSKNNNSSIFEDLYITGAHAILYDNLSERENEKMLEIYESIKNKYNENYKLTINDKYKLIAYYDNSFEDVKYVGKINIFHLVLEKNNINQNNYGIYANGLLVESTDDLSLYRNLGFKQINLKKNKDITSYK